MRIFAGGTQIGFWADCPLWLFFFAPHFLNAEVFYLIPSFPMRGVTRTMDDAEDPSILVVSDLNMRKKMTHRALRLALGLCTYLDGAMTEKV